MDKQAYRTTDRAGYFVAGQRVPSVQDGDGNLVAKVGHVLHLTEAEAKYELLEGTIELVSETVEAAPLAPGKGTKPNSNGVEG